MEDYIRALFLNHSIADPNNLSVIHTIDCISVEEVSDFQRLTPNIGFLDTKLHSQG